MNDQAMSEDFERPEAYYAEANSFKVLCRFLNEECIDHILNYINPECEVTIEYKDGYIDHILVHGDEIWQKV